MSHSLTPLHLIHYWGPPWFTIVATSDHFQGKASQEMFGTGKRCSSIDKITSFHEEKLLFPNRWFYSLSTFSNGGLTKFSQLSSSILQKHRWRDNILPIHSEKLQKAIISVRKPPYLLYQSFRSENYIRDLGSPTTATVVTLLEGELAQWTWITFPLCVCSITWT